MLPRVTPLVAVVEIGKNLRWLWLIVGVFLLTFVAVCGIAYLLLARRTHHSVGGSTLELEIGARLPVSKDGFALISGAAALGTSRPALTPAARSSLDDLSAVAGAFTGIYRGLMIVVGLIGLTAAIVLLRAHTPANMRGLPGGILLLLSLGALLEGLMHRRSMGPDRPIDQAVLDKLRVNVRTEPLRVSLSDSDMRSAAEAVGSGMSIADAARAVYPGYGGLGALEKQALETALEQAVKSTGLQQSD